jgi:hypothetical protein
MLNIFVSTLQPDGSFGTPTLVQELKSNVQGPPGGDGPVSIRNDGLEMVLNWSTVQGVFIDSDLWISRRRSLMDPWSTPQQLGATLNTSFAEGSPSLSCDGTAMYFASTRTGGSGGTDIWMRMRTPLDISGKK